MSEKLHLSVLCTTGYCSFRANSSLSSLTMTLSTRISIQWPPELAAEESHTLVITSPQDHFVDIRVLKDKYNTKNYEGSFNDNFQWCITGKEVPIPNTNKIKFVHELDSAVIIGGENPGDPDVGEFSNIEGSEDRKEVGSMKNPKTNTIELYIEIWRSLCPLNSTPEVEVREQGLDVPVIVLEVKTDLLRGKYIRYGNWLQGIVFDNKELHVVRAHYSSSWNILIEYGNIYLFPIDNEIDDVDQTVDVGSLTWNCIEFHRPL